MSFFRQVKKFTDLAEGRMMNVIRTSCILLVEDAQRPVYEGGRMPVKTGALRDSLYCTASGSRFEGIFAYLPAAAALQAGGVFTFGWSIHYAVHQEYGTRNHPARFFARGAIQQWSAFVAEAKRMHSR